MGYCAGCGGWDRAQNGSGHKMNCRFPHGSPIGPNLSTYPEFKQASLSNDIHVFDTDSILNLKYRRSPLSPIFTTNNGTSIALTNPSTRMTKVSDFYQSVSFCVPSTKGKGPANWPKWFPCNYMQGEEKFMSNFDFCTMNEPGKSIPWWFIELVNDKLIYITSELLSHIYKDKSLLPVRFDNTSTLRITNVKSKTISGWIFTLEADHPTGALTVECVLFHEVVYPKEWSFRTNTFSNVVSTASHSVSPATIYYKTPTGIEIPPHYPLALPLNGHLDDIVSFPTFFCVENKKHNKRYAFVHYWDRQKAKKGILTLACRQSPSTQIDIVKNTLNKKWECTV